MRYLFIFLGLLISIGVFGKKILPHHVTNCVEKGEELYPFNSGRSFNDIMKGKVTYVTKDGLSLKTLEQKNVYRSRAKQMKDEELFSLNINMPEAGKLLEILGENLELVQSLTVTGKINADDLNTLWNAGYYGKLVEIDLGDSQMEDGYIPPFSMLHRDEQLDTDTGIVYCLGLRKLILPSNVTEIGKSAFAFLIELEELVLPESIVIIGETAFSDCQSLPNSSLNLPEGLEVIGYQAFYNCPSLAGEVAFPQSLRYLMGGSFYMCRLTKVTFPENLEGIGMADFYGCRLTEVDIPDNCFLNPYGLQFYGNIGLQRAHLPEHSDNVPTYIFGLCEKLTEVNIPNDTKWVYSHAFEDSELLTEVNFPEGLLKIRDEAFTWCGLTELNFPSTLEELGGACFGNCVGVTKISCKALIPPVCKLGSEMYPDYGPFGNIVSHNGINSDIPVYIPLGTKVLYEQTIGWNYFSNFIETDFSTGINDPSRTLDLELEPLPTYDIQGRQVLQPQSGQIFIQSGKKHLLHK